MATRQLGRLRDSPLLAGAIETLGPHPVLRAYSTANARLPDGKMVPVALLTLPAQTMIDEHGGVEVLFLYDPRAEYSFVIGVRPMPKSVAGAFR